MEATEKARIKSRIEGLLSEILTDKYGEEYGVKIKMRFVPQEGEKRHGKSA